VERFLGIILQQRLLFGCFFTMNSFKHLFIITITFLGFATANAQTGFSGDKGAYLNYNDYVNAPRAFGGDYEIDVNGYLQIGANGTMEVVGAVKNKGTILLDSGALLTIFGDMLNDGTIILKRGAKINFLGEIWTNTVASKVIDGTAPNTIPGGELTFDVNRPRVPAPWLTASPYLLDYSDENTRQYIDGGNTPMDVVLHLHNKKDIHLVNTSTRIEGEVHWMVDSSVVQIGDNDLIFTKNASQYGYNAKNFIVTNGTGHVVKENYTGNWVFPVGKSKGDYTPAAINNSTPNTMHVSVTDYASSASVENPSTAETDGMDRTWNIYADIALGVSSITLQHNSATNLSSFAEAYNFVTRWSNATPNLTGDMESTTAWQLNNASESIIGNLSTTGSIAGSSMNSRTYSNFATSPSDSIAYFTKSSLAFAESSVQMTSFRVDSMRCESAIKFSTAKEVRIKIFQLQHSVDGLTYSTIATFAPKGNNSDYEYQHETPVSGTNYYRLVFVDEKGDYKISDVVTTIVSCDAEPSLVLYPNPAKDYINLSSLVGPYEIRIMNMNGRVVSAISTTNTTERIDISMLPVSHYILQAISSKNKITNIKFVKY